MKVKYYIKQLPLSNKDIFRGTDSMCQLYDLKRRLNNYVSVWTDEIEIADESEVTVLDACEELFRIFNIEHPKNYAGRSMSVSDIVVFKFNNNTRYFYCDNYGFTELTEKGGQQ